MENCEKPKCEPCMGIKPVQPHQPKTCKKMCGCSLQKVTIPSSLGDDSTGEMLPENGLYTNSIVEYEANNAQYLYDSNGIYTKLVGKQEIAELERRIAALEAIKDGQD